MRCIIANEIKHVSIYGINLPHRLKRYDDQVSLSYEDAAK